jgi:hypothetical protein
MHWDIVEVAPKGGYSLFVRFKDGLEGSCIYSKSS